MAHESSNDLNTPMILVIGLVSAVATFAIILLLIAMYNSVQSAQTGRQVNVEYADPGIALDRQRQSLREPAMIDAGTGQVRLPIDVAMAKVVRGLESDPGNDGVRNSKFVNSAKIASDAVPADAETAAEDREEDTGDAISTPDRASGEDAGSDGEADGAPVP